MTTPAVPNALASEFTPNARWLGQNTQQPAGKGPVTTGPVEPISQPVNATAPVDLNPPVIDWTETELRGQAPDYIPQPVNPLAGPWTPLPEKWDGKEAFGTLPDDGIEPIGYYKVPPGIPGLEQRDDRYPGHDRHSQTTDTAGWEQYTPSSRIPARHQYWWQQYLGVEPFWPITKPNLTRAKPARGGDQMVAGVVAQYGDLANSGGDTVYEPAPPPPVSTQPPVPAGPGTIPQWGF